MGLSKILLFIVILTACGCNVEGTLVSNVCSGVSRGLNFIFCWINRKHSVGCDDDNLKIRFYLYKKISAETQEEQKICSGSKCKFDFDPDKKTAIIIHGFLANRYAAWIPPMITELHNLKEDRNVIVVEWFKHIDYVTAAQTVEAVANKTAKMIREQLFKNRLVRKPIHLIGHSLGAHISGLTASQLKNTAWHVYRVTGLDPAKPLFDTKKNKRYRLNKNCANFVDVIHTNSGPNRATFGHYKPMGHIDFYPNAGDWQPACDYSYSNESRSFGEDAKKCFERNTWSMRGVAGLTFNFINRLESGHNMICDHEIAPVYFTESLRGGKRRFFATRVKSLAEVSVKRPTAIKDCSAAANCAEMGIHAVNYKKRPGIYVLASADVGVSEPTRALLPTLLDYFQVQDLTLQGVADALNDAASFVADTVYGYFDDDDDDDEESSEESPDDSSEDDNELFGLE